MAAPVPHEAPTSPRFGVVVKEVVGEDGPTFQAMAFVLSHSGVREPIINGDGHPFVAFGASPLKATNYLLSALRRKSLIDRTTGPVLG
jgi:hypothetical protein